MTDLTSSHLEQIERVLYMAKNLKPGNDLECERLVTLCRAVVHRVTKSDSPYAVQLSTLPPRATDTFIIPRLVGIVAALRDDLKAGYSKTAEELIHGEVFGDFLEMADHLLDQGYKDAAAVMAGSTLEAHQRQLCQKFAVDTEFTDSKGTLRPKPPERINSDLVKASAYSKLDQKNVTAWLGLRHKAAHGEYDKYTLEQVKLLNQGVRDFIARNPA